MKRVALPLALSMLLLAIVIGSASAVVAADLDQHQETHDLSIGTTMNLGQGFTAGKTGDLTDVELYMNGKGTFPMAVYATDTVGKPTGTPLASTSVQATSNIDGWTTFHFATPAAVTAGVKYVFTFNVGAEAAAWGTAEGYTNGQALQDLGSDGWWVVVPSHWYDIGDFAFRTYVATEATESSAAPSAAESSAAPSSAAPSAAASSAAPSSAASSPRTITPPPTTTGQSAPSNGNGVPLVTILMLGILVTTGLATAASARAGKR